VVKKLNNDLGIFLEKLRGKLSLREASKKSGLSHTYIRDLELGVNRKTKSEIKPTPETLKRLADAYKYPYEELLKIAGIIPTSTDDELADILVAGHSNAADIKIKVEDVLYYLEKSEFDEQIVAEVIKDTLYRNNIKPETYFLHPYKYKNEILKNSIIVLSLILSSLQNLTEKKDIKNEEFDLEKVLRGKTLKWGEEVLTEEDRKKAIEMLKILFNFKQDT
jgi:transcriptional regulator with XRE-family HTH domain